MIPEEYRPGRRGCTAHPAPRGGRGGGSNEELIARLLKERRDEVQLATKFGLVGNPAKGYTDIRGDRAHIRQAVEASLKRLDTDTIDLYYMHRRDLRVPIGETVEAMAELVQQGKVRHLGLSEVTAGELREACCIHPIAAVQSEWSIWSRDVERNVVPAAVELGVVAAVQSVAAELSAGMSVTGQSVTPTQVALAWLLAQGGRLGLPVVPIPGTRKAERIDENLGALALSFTPAQLEKPGATGEARRRRGHRRRLPVRGPQLGVRGP